MQNYQASQYLYSELIPLKTNKDEIQSEFAKKLELPVDLSFLTEKRLFQVFTHKSFTHENKEFELNNERLEFIGDAVLDLIVSDIIFSKFPNKKEGDLSKIRSSLVNEKSLAEIASKIELGKYILLGRGELKLKGFEKKSILSDAFEAILGGIYIDHGFEKVTSFFNETLNYLATKHNWDFFDLKSLESFDAKTKLQEIVMERFKEVPTYVVKEETKDKETTFHVSVVVNDNVVAKMSGPSKKKTMQTLANKILNENLLDKDAEKACY